MADLWHDPDNGFRDLRNEILFDCGVTTAVIAHAMPRQQLAIFMLRRILQSQALGPFVKMARGHGAASQESELAIGATNL